MYSRHSPTVAILRATSQRRVLNKLAWTTCSRISNATSASCLTINTAQYCSKHPSASVCAYLDHKLQPLLPSQSVELLHPDHQILSVGRDFGFLCRSLFH